MDLNDFTQLNPTEWESTDILHYEDDKISFNYRWKISAFRFQEGWGGKYKTRYKALFVIDESSRHETHKDSLLEDILYGFIVYKKEFKSEDVTEEDLTKVAEKLKETKIKTALKGKYKKVKAIINGEHFMV